MDDSQKIQQLVKAKQHIFTALSDSIWGTPELFFQETHSAEALAAVLRSEGFSMQEAVDGMPTAFIGQFGSGGPIIGILGEFDALPSLSQAAGSTERNELVPGGPGHACGHNALGSGSLAAAVAVKDYMALHGLQGTIRYYGCPAEEAGWSKMFLARDGFFADLAAALTWHPSHVNTVQGASSLANLCVYFRFSGKTAHAAASPHLGRSALDACEIMSVGVNYLREHIIPEARVHYAYQDVGGHAPNVVQDHACVKYFIRAPKIKQVLEIAERVKDIANGAALISGTTVRIEVTGGMCDFVPNEALSGILGEALLQVGPPAFDDADRALATRFQALCTDGEKAAATALVTTLYPGNERLPTVPLIEEIAPFTRNVACSFGSTDVGDVSQAVPAAQLNIACYANGTALHSWQLTAQSGTAIAHKGLLCAAAALALGAVMLMKKPDTLQRARAEYVKVTGGKYICPVGDDVIPGQ